MLRDEGVAISKPEERGGLDNQNIRWVRRWGNYQKALQQLKEAVELQKYTDPGMPAVALFN